MSWHVLTGRPLHERALDVLDEFAEVTVSNAARGEPIEAIGDYDAIILGGLTVSEADLARAGDLKVVTAPGVGLDSVDVRAATREGVIVCNNPGANTRAVAEYTIASMLAVRRQLRRADRETRDGTWDKYRYQSSEVAGQVMGVVGCGAIGSLVLELAGGLGMEGVAFDPYVDEDDLDPAVEMVETTGDLFSAADAVGIHAPLTEETEGLVGAPELRALGADGVLVNAARGPIVDREALVSALREGAIWGAGIDVFDEEPVPEDHPLLELDNVLVSPHMAGSTRVSVPAKDVGAARNVRAVFEGALPESTVNRDELCMSLAFDGDPPEALDPTAF